MSLIDKLRASRLSKVQVGSFEFTITRPTALDMVKLSGADKDEMLKRFVVDWHGVKELDLIPGGDPFEVPFDKELFFEWLSDNPQFWEAIIKGIVDAYRAHEEKRTDNEKKVNAG